MKDISVDLMQYALVGASLFILVAVGFLAIWWKGLAKRDAKKELKNKKKAEKKQQKLEAKQQAKTQKSGQQLKPTVQEEEARAEEIAREEAAVRAEEAARAEAAVRAEEVARAEAAARAEEIARAEAAVRAEEVARAEAAAKVEEVARAEAAVRAEEAARAEAAVRAEEAARAEAAVRAEEVARAEAAAKAQVVGATVAAVGVQIPRFETAHIENDRVFTIKFYKMQTSQLFENYSFRLEDSLTIGRNPGYHHWTIVDDLTVSGNHCKIYQKDGQVYILDLNSTNGTYVNDQRVRGQMKLENHDKIGIGQGSYRIRIE
ncbi:FHA domain-containing protein [Niameybacter massiliensis]|uniref:FHA domain-containing protein n=1 Tax=Niameybacter massiliensis TaxID=1658108 RepID=UPI0006B44EC6|nr:FHA domain-containing protein [Niameybacter massiliensis]